MPDTTTYREFTETLYQRNYIWFKASLFVAYFAIVFNDPARVNLNNSHFAPDLNSRRNMQNARFKRQYLISSCNILYKNNQNPGGKISTGLYKNGHNWLSHMLRRSGIKPSTLRPTYV